MTIRRLKEEVEKRGYITVGPEESVFDVSVRMVEEGHDAALVMCENQVWGIITTNDIAFRIVAEGKSPKSIIAASIMTAPVHDLKVTPHTTLEECRFLMRGKNVRHLPLLENGKVVGIVTALDVADFRHDEEIRRAMEVSGAMMQTT